MDKIKTVKIKNPDGSVSEESYTISVDAKNVDMANGKELQETIGTIDIDNDGDISNQLKDLKNKINKIDIIDNLESNDKNKVLSANQGKIINNKLNKKTYYFNNVAEMKKAKLKAGDFAITLGYYEPNDGGGANYYITNVKNIKKYQEEIGTLFAELIVDKEINPLQIGMHNNGIDNNSDIFKKLINIAIINNLKIIFTNGTYFFNSKIIINNEEYKDKNLNINFNNTNIIIDNINNCFLEIHYLNSLSIKNLKIESNFNSDNGYSNSVALHLYWINKINIKNIVLNNMNSLIQTDYIESIDTNFLSTRLIIENIECIDCPLLGYFNNLKNVYIENINMKKGLLNINVREVFYIRTNVVNFYADNLNINNVERYLLHCNRLQTDGNYSPAIGIKPSNNINITNVNISFNDTSNYTYLLHFDSDDESVYMHNIKISNTDGLIGVTEQARIKNIRLNKIYLAGSKNIKKLYDLSNNIYNINNLICEDISINQKIVNNTITGLINNLELKNNKYNNTYINDNPSALFLFINNTNNLLIDNIVFNDTGSNTLNQFIQISNSSCEAIVRNMLINASEININYILIASGSGNSKLILHDNFINSKTAKKIANNQEGNIAIEYNNYINSELSI